jgi:hypothetical protein
MGLKKAIPRLLETDGRECAPELLKAFNNVYVDHFCRVGQNGEVNDREKLSNSIEAIRKYEVVEIYEDYSSFLGAVANLIGLDIPTTIAKKNVTSRRPRVDQISSTLREQLIAWNQLDLQFYSEVVKLKESVNDRLPCRPMVNWHKYDQGPMVVSNTKGLLCAYNPESSISAGSERNLSVTIHNNSDERWMGDTYHRINASYHWARLSGEVHTFDGCRTQLPDEGIMPGEVLALDLRVLAPEEPGCYTLVLTLVQEGVCWFEEREFKPALLQIEVK